MNTNSHLFIKYKCKHRPSNVLLTHYQADLVINARPIKWNELQSNLSFDVMIEMC